MPTLPTFLARSGRAAIALAGLLLLTGCEKLNFWRMDGHQSTIVVDGPVAREQLDLFIVTCWVSLVIFILVGAVLAYATFKFRARSLDDEHAEPPEQSHGNPLVELSLIVASILALVVIAIPTVKGIWNTYDVPEAEKKDALQVTATGFQWWFKFEYPKEEASADASDPSKKTPLITANELVIPAGRAVRIQLRTFDVIHSFWVPKLGGKVDMIPNRANHIYLKADKPGYFWGQCAEYCGDSHAVMRFRVIALDQPEYAAWLEKQKQLARTDVASIGTLSPQFAALKNFKTNEAGITAAYDKTPLDAWRAKQKPEAAEDAALVAKGRELFTGKTCGACHTIRGLNGAGGLTAPDLTHFGSRTTLAGGLLENDDKQLRRWIHDPLAVKPGNKMHFGVAGMAGYMKKNADKVTYSRNITLTADDEIALVAYLQSLK